MQRGASQFLPRFHERREEPRSSYLAFMNAERSLAVLTSLSWTQRVQHAERSLAVLTSLSGTHQFGPVSSFICTCYLCIGIDSTPASIEGASSCNSMIHTTQSLPEGTFSRPYMFVRGTLSRHIKKSVSSLRLRCFVVVSWYLYCWLLVPGRSITTCSSLSGFRC